MVHYFSFVFTEYNANTSLYEYLISKPNIPLISYTYISPDDVKLGINIFHRQLLLIIKRQADMSNQSEHQTLTIELKYDTPRCFW